MYSNERLISCVSDLNAIFWGGSQDGVSPFTFWTDGLTAGISLYNEVIWDGDDGANPELMIKRLLAQRVHRLNNVLASDLLNPIVREG